MNFETYNYRGHSFTVWEYEDHFLVIVDDNTYKFNALIDVKEFMQYYGGGGY